MLSDLKILFRDFQNSSNSNISQIWQDKLSEIQLKYEALFNKLKNPAVSVPNAVREYLPHLDTLKTAMKFLNQNGAAGSIAKSISHIESFDSRALQAEEIGWTPRDSPTEKYAANMKDSAREPVPREDPAEQIR